MKWNDLATLPSMPVASPGPQQPLGPGQRARLSALWEGGSREAPVAESALSIALPVVTSVAELEALAERPVVPAEEIDLSTALELEPEAADFAPTGVTCDLTRAPVLPPAELHTRLTHDFADRLSGLAEHRVLWPLATKADSERRALAQIDALVCIGAPAFDDLTAWWQSTPTPWASFAFVLAFASLDGREAIEAIATHVAELGPKQREHRRLAAEAFALSANAHAVPLARALLPTPGCEAFAIELLSLGQLMSDGDLRAWLDRPDPEIRAAVLRAWARLDETPREIATLERLLDTSDPDLGWEAARALTLWGSGAPLSAVRHGGALFDVLGERAVELFVLSGHTDDSAQMQRLVRRMAMTPTLLDRIARFGHPGTWAFLTHYLGDGALDGAAIEALVTLFGDIVALDEQRDPFAWEKAIGELRLDASAGQRYRSGKPWSPAVVAAECASGDLSRQAVELRLDELWARSRVRSPAALWAWAEHHRSFASDLVAACHPRRTPR